MLFSNDTEMTLKTEDLRDIAHLARLHIEDNNIDRYADDLSSILELVEQMNQVDSSGVKPLANPLDATQRLRDDEEAHRLAHQALEGLTGGDFEVRAARS